MTDVSGCSAPSKPRRAPRPQLTHEQRAERLSAAREQLLAGVERLLTSDGWQQLIQSRAWLRRYSLNNILMILQQCPEATDVRPLSQWRKAGYGFMRKGTHKIMIWKPKLQKIEPGEGDDTTAGGLRVAGFMLVPVVDVSQLQGDPVAARPTGPVELSGDVPAGLWAGVADQVRACGYTVELGDCGDAYGKTVFAERRMVVRSGLAPAQRAKTLTHELAHILCVHEDRGTRESRALLEVEAESVACIVAAVCGLDTLEYSVPYVAGWAENRDVAHDSADRVLDVADWILHRLDSAAQ